MQQSQLQSIVVPHIFTSAQHPQGVLHVLSWITADEEAPKPKGNDRGNRFRGFSMEHSCCTKEESFQLTLALARLKGIAEKLLH